MRYLFKVAGLVLAAIFVVSMFASATASATKPVWERCASEATGTKWTTNQCTTAAGTGAFGWKEMPGTEATRARGSLLMVDTKTLLGESQVECSGETTGFVGPGKVGQITQIEVSPAQCRGIKNCTKVEAVEARNLPWSTEIFQTEGKPESKLVKGTGGEPGWSMTCKVLVNVTDECLQVAGKEETVTLANTATSSELLVLFTLNRLRKAKCTQGGVESGEIIGSVALLLEGMVGFRIT